MDDGTVKAATGVSAVILAAGMSTRMGRPKMILPWGEHSVIEQVIQVLRACDIEDICVVTGGAREEVEAVLQRISVRMVFNPEYADGEMLHSLQAGLRCISIRSKAVLVVLGDQPQIKPAVVTAVIQAFQQGGSELVIPSYLRRRGHPWLMDRALSHEVLTLAEDVTMREFLEAHRNRIEYVNLDEPSILADLDTPEDYQRQKPAHPEMKETG